VIEPFYDVFHDLAQILEIEKETGFVQLGSSQRHPNLVVVAMRVFALALIIAQVMACSKRIVNGYFEHASLSGSACIQAGPGSMAKRLL
jgi:hypothetical protein